MPTPRQYYLAIGVGLVASASNETKSSASIPTDSSPPHWPSSDPLTDRIDLPASSAFSSLSRHTRLHKIEGIRISFVLQALGNLVLQAGAVGVVNEPRRILGPFK
jgi:hypothetical protein